MKILISNKFYYPRGGSEMYTMELARLLIKGGHEVAIFSMQHPNNLETKFADLFPREVDANKRDFRNIFYSVIRPFGSSDVRRNFRKILRDFNPDLVHLNNIHSQLSPVLALIAFKEKVPVVWTLHDHKLLCPRYDCIRNEQPCELCFKKKFNVVKYRCMKRSLLASLVAYFEALVWNKRLLEKTVGLFINPSFFLMNNMIKGGFDKAQMEVLPNFVMDEKLCEISLVRSDYYCYIGRLSKEKGVETLLDAASSLPQYNLIVVGTGPQDSELRKKFDLPNISFVGHKNWGELKSILSQALFSVVPSECYENSPLSLIESLCFGTPVLGSRIGGIPELINEGINGLTFKTGNLEDLRQKIAELHKKSHNLDFTEIARKSRVKFSSEKYYESLIEMYDKILNRD